jgi:hypothetical protein
MKKKITPTILLSMCRCKTLLGGHKKVERTKLIPEEVLTLATEKSYRFVKYYFQVIPNACLFLFQLL